jgi:hypothetical protein
MIIALCGSMAFTDQMIEVRRELERLGHEVVVSKFADLYQGKSQEEIAEATIHDKMHNDAIREFWPKVQHCDALLVLNYDRKGIKGYIGGNTFLEIGFAHVLGKSVFFLNSIPDIDLIRSELEAMRPVMIHGDLQRIC